jgi:hypothetical protein
LSDIPETDHELDARDREVALELTGRRPVPAARFRGALRRQLAADDPGYGPRPVHLRAIVLLYLTAGALLLALGALQALGRL